MLGLGIFYVEARRALCRLAVHDTVQAGLAIDLLGGPEQRAAWLPRLSAGSLRGTTSLSAVRDAAALGGRTLGFVDRCQRAGTERRATHPDGRTHRACTVRFEDVRVAESAAVLGAVSAWPRMTCVGW